MNIKKASELTGVSSDTIRYYERIGILPPIPRNDNGIREFTDEEVRWIEFTKHFRNAGMSIEKLAEYIKLFDQGDSTILARIELLEEEKERLLEKRDEIQANLDKLDYKIENYKNIVVPIEKTLKKFSE
ncbi:MerR family transcriptional regulator [Gemella cuniculi]|uniref:MerR family transcriptional regulator n=1 Tax=Gemella cuniculi TaxID=150240 RepID=UPI000415FAC9|nr:MerR family transcriptional regulator [Gemella cuniculi]